MMSQYVFAFYFILKGKQKEMQGQNRHNSTKNYYPILPFY